jgi:hypothetical protein
MNHPLGIPTLPPYQFIQEPADILESGHAVNPLVPAPAWANTLMLSSRASQYPILLAYESWQAIYGYSPNTFVPSYFRNPTNRFASKNTLIRLPRAVTTTGATLLNIAATDPGVAGYLDSHSIFAAAQPNFGTSQGILQYFPAAAETTVTSPNGFQVFRVVVNPATFSGGQLLNYVELFIDSGAGLPQPSTRYLGVEMNFNFNVLVSVTITQNTPVINYDLAQLAAVQGNFDKIGYVFLWTDFGPGVFGQPGGADFTQSVNQAGHALAAQLAAAVPNGSYHILSVNQLNAPAALVLADLESFFGP